MAATRLDKRIDTAAMVPHFTGAELSVSYHEERYEGYLWACDSCGLVWERKWHADECGERGHVLSFSQRYGGFVENGVWQGGSEYVRRSHGRIGEKG